MANKKILVLIFAVLIIGGGLAAYFILFNPPLVEEDDEDSEKYPIYFSEIYYHGSDPDEEYIELYIDENFIGNLSGWKISLGSGTNITLPYIPVETYTFLCLHVGNQDEWSGEYELFPEERSLKVFLNQTIELLSDSGDNLLLIDPKDNIVDVISWGSALGGIYNSWFFKNGTDMIAESGKSLSIWGEDLNNSGSWYSSRSTPATPNVDEIYISNLNITVVIYNGFYQPFLTRDQGYWQGNPPIRVTGPGVSIHIRNRIRDFVNQSIQLYKSLGLGTPELGPDGVVDIRVGYGNSPDSSGVTFDNGSITIWIGRNATVGEVKVVVEHELMHAVQVAVVNNISHSTAPVEWWWDEGMAEYWGLRSAMAEFNLTMAQIQDVLNISGSINWHIFFRSLNVSLFTPWRGTGDRYVGSMMFVKFLEEVYGENTSIKIHNRIKRDQNGTQITGATEAIEAELGKPLDQIIREFYQWVYLNASSANGAPQITADVSLNYTGSSVSDSVNVSPTGAVVEEININNETDITVDFQSNQTMMITVIIEKNDGTVETYWYRYYPGGTNAPILINAGTTSKVTIIKVNPSNSTFGQINMTANIVEENESAFSFNPVQFSEIYYLGADSSSEYIELYIDDNYTYNLLGWKIVLGSGVNIMLPDINVSTYNYLNLHMGNETSWTGEYFPYPSNHSFKYFYNLTGDILNDTGEDLLLMDPDNNIIDVMSWGISLGGLYNSSFYKNGTDLIADTGQSLSIWGSDLNNSGNWYSSIPTPATPNVDLLNISEHNLTVMLYNGFYLPYVFVDEAHGPAIPTISVTGARIPLHTRNRVRDFVNQSIQLYQSLGLGLPELGPDGEVDIKVGHGTSPDSTGLTYDNGSITIWIGRNATVGEVKVVVEHELMHAVQVANINNISHSTAPAEWWWDEGMAEYWGMRSAMAEFNLNMSQIQDILNGSGSINWHKYFRSFNHPLFTPWEGTGDRYVGSMMFIKFLEEVYGDDTSVNIHNRIKRDKNGTQIVGAKDAVEAEIGKSLEEIMQEFYQWVYLEAATANGAPQITADVSLNFTGSSVGDSVLVSPTGAVVEEIHINDESDLSLDFESNQSMVITVIIELKNGTKQILTYTYNPEGTNAAIPVSSASTSKVTIIKMNPNNTTYGQINMTASVVVNTISSPGTGTSGNPLNISSYDFSHTGILPYYNDTNLNSSAWFWYGLFINEGEYWEFNVTAGEGSTGTFEVYLISDNSSLPYSGNIISGPSDFVIYSNTGSSWQYYVVILLTGYFSSFIFTATMPG